jgi:hypothetical protein
MSSKPERLRHFLLVFDHAQAKLIEQQEFSNVVKAMAVYADRETKYDANAKIEVVLIGADSIETVKQTHANYFDGTAALAHAMAIILKDFAPEGERSDLLSLTVTRPSRSEPS